MCNTLQTFSKEVFDVEIHDQCAAFAVTRHGDDNNVAVTCLITVSSPLVREQLLNGVNEGSLYAVCLKINLHFSISYYNS